LGRIAHAGETATKVGTIAILGSHPDYQQRGIATELVKALCERFRSRGIKTVRIDVDRRDKPLLDFVEHMGFGVGHLIDYSKAI
jgi:ribosomal protein S18 acetylase RimI-like enzyme